MNKLFMDMNNWDHPDLGLPKSLKNFSNCYFEPVGVYDLECGSLCSIWEPKQKLSLIPFYHLLFVRLLNSSPSFNSWGFPKTSSFSEIIWTKEIKNFNFEVGTYFLISQIELRDDFNKRVNYIALLGKLKFSSTNNFADLLLRLFSEF